MAIWIAAMLVLSVPLVRLLEEAEEDGLCLFSCEMLLLLDCPRLSPQMCPLTLWRTIVVYCWVLLAAQAGIGSAVRAAGCCCWMAGWWLARMLLWYATEG